MPEAATATAREDGPLGRLVGDVETFLASSFGRRPRHRPVTGPDHASTLLTLDDVDHLVASSGLRAPAFRLVRAGRTLPSSAVTRRARIGSRPVHDLVDVGAVHREFAAGATIVLQGLHRSWPPVAELCQELEASLTHPAQANAYLTPPVAQGLNLHADPHDVFVVQTHGSKRWVVHPGPDEEAWDLTLTAGDVLYLPVGTRHAAQTTDEPSLHLTIGVRTTTWRDLVRRAVADALDELEAETGALDRSLPAGWAHEPSRLEAGLRERLGDLAGLLPARAPDAAEQRAEGFWAARLPDLSGGLRDQLEADALVDDTPLAVRAGATCRLRTDADGLLVVLGDRRLRTSVGLGPVLEAILERRRFAPQDLDELIDGPSRLVLCRRLVREGLLTIDRRAAT